MIVVTYYTTYTIFVSWRQVTPLKFCRPFTYPSYPIVRPFVIAREVTTGGCRKDPPPVPFHKTIGVSVVVRYLKVDDLNPPHPSSSHFRNPQNLVVGEWLTILWVINFLTRWLDFEWSTYSRDMYTTPTKVLWSYGTLQPLGPDIGLSSGLSRDKNRMVSVEVSSH